MAKQANIFFTISHQSVSPTDLKTELDKTCETKLPFFSNVKNDSSIF